MDPFAHRKWYPYTTSAITSLSWDPKSNTHTAFRARRKHKHHTWARTFYAYPELYLQPENEKELVLIVDLARQAGKKIMLVGSGHSPSDLTCTSGWMVNLDKMNRVLGVDEENHRITVQAGIRLYQLQDELDKRGMAMPNMGSILEQSIAGAISTCTHGSSLQHGLLSQNILSLQILLANGKIAECNEESNPELFQAALASLGALGIITVVQFQAVPAFRLSWKQEVILLNKVIGHWNDLWTEAEFARVWWFPYSQRAIYWRAKRTEEDLVARPTSWYGSWLGYHAYQIALYICSWFPKLTPAVERWVFSMQYGWEEGTTGTAVEKSVDALTMDCLFSQHVNEWAIPLEKGPEAIARFQAWLENKPDLAMIPFDSKGVYVHAPIEVRVSDTSRSPTPRPWLDQSIEDGPTLYLNATLYRPYYTDFPAKDRYYEAFEWLMKEMGGKPHWAKNWETVSREELYAMYPRLADWVALRNKSDPKKIFVSEWLQNRILPEEDIEEEVTVEEKGEKTPVLSASEDESFAHLASSTESFDMMGRSEVFTPMSGSIESLSEVDTPMSSSIESLSEE